MDSDKAVKLFRMCIKAEQDFRNESRPTLIRKAIKKQHEFYWVSINDLRKKEEKSDCHLKPIEILAFKILKLELTGRLGIELDEEKHRVNLFNKKGRSPEYGTYN